MILPKRLPVALPETKSICPTFFNIKEMQDYCAQTDFSFGEISNKFFLQTDFAPRAGGVLKAKNIMPYVSGGMFKRFGLRSLGSLCFAEAIDITKTKVCFYEAEDTCFMLVLTAEALIAYDINSGEFMRKEMVVNLIPDAKNSEESKKANKELFEQIASEIDSAQCGKELILTHQAFKPKVVSYSEEKKEFTCSDFKIAACGYWNKELPVNDILIKVLPSPSSQDANIEVITKCSIEKLKEVLLNSSLCERNGAGRCFIRSYGGTTTRNNEKVHTFDVLIIKEFTEQASAGFTYKDYFILKKPMWGESNPAVVAFHESRLIFGGYEDDRVVLYFSKVNDFHDFGEGQGRADDAFIGGIASGERQKITGIVSGTSLQIFTNKYVYFALHGGIQPITAETITIAKQIHQGSKNLFDSLLNDETLFVGADECNIYSLQRINVNNYHALNLSLTTSNMIKNPVSIGCSKFVNTGCKNSGCDKKYRYLFVVNGDGSLAVCQTLLEEQKIAWTSIATEGGKFKHVFCHQEKVLFIVARGGRNFIETFDACLFEDESQTYDIQSQRYVNKKYPVNIELELFPLLSLKKISFFTPQLLFHKQVISELYVYFEGAADFKINNHTLNTNEIYPITEGIRIGRVILGNEWSYGQTVKITYSGMEDLKIYGVIALVKRG
jgi:hypothetical protein